MATATEPKRINDPGMSDEDRVAAEAFENDENGKSIEDLADEGEAEDEEGQTFLDFGDALNLKVAGKKPTVSKIKIRAISQEIKGQLGDKGDDEEVFVLVRAGLDEVTTKSFKDGNRKLVRKERRHVLEPFGVVRIPEADAEELFEKYQQGIDPTQD